MQSESQLQEEIDKGRREIFTDGYPMSVGELINLYREGDLEVHPDFQRLFRWSPKQKSRLIESLLLGIPIPSIFIHQRQDGVWDVIDGVQRLSTILEFVGELRNANGEKVSPDPLTETDYLTSLKGMYWSQDFGHPHFSPEQQRFIKRTAIDLKIVTRESDSNAKFDLFQRLNTGGTQLAPQETRNALLVMTNPNFYQWLLQLSKDEHFQVCTSLSDNNLDQRYDMELALRFILLKDLSADELRSVGDISDFLSEGAVSIAKAASEEEDLTMKHHSDFSTVFHFLFEATGPDTFRRYDSAKQQFLGPFTVSSFETISLGVHANRDRYSQMDRKERVDLLASKIKGLWTDEDFREFSKPGTRANSRISKTVPFGREYFEP